MTVYTELLLGSTHRFIATFKDVVTEAPIAMTNVTVKFFRADTQVGETDTPSLSDVGVYYYDKEFNDSTFSKDKYECRFDGDTLSGSIHKRASKFFVLVSEPTVV